MFIKSNKVINPTAAVKITETVNILRHYVKTGQCLPCDLPIIRGQTKPSLFVMWELGADWREKILTCDKSKLIKKFKYTSVVMR